jgi:hypothetical protein
MVFRSCYERVRAILEAQLEQQGSGVMFSGAQGNGKVREGINIAAYLHLPLICTFVSFSGSRGAAFTWYGTSLA